MLELQQWPTLTSRRHYTISKNLFTSTVPPYITTEPNDLPPLHFHYTFYQLRLLDTAFPQDEIRIIYLATWMKVIQAASNNFIAIIIADVRRSP